MDKKLKLEGGVFYAKRFNAMVSDVGYGKIF